MASDGSHKLSLGEKVGYSLGDCGANFVFQTQLVFLMSFYTEVLGLAASTVGTMFLVSRFFDAINDPFVGAAADRTSTRWGKYRPWVLATAVPFAICFVLAYTAPDFGPTGRVVWAFVTYNLLMLVYTANNIPYSALTGVVTGDPDERTSLLSWRFLMAMSAAFLVQTFTPDLIDWFGSLGEGELVDKGAGYQGTMTLWAVLAVACFAVTFFSTRERVRPDPDQSGSMVTDLTDLGRNGTWVALATATVCVFTYLALRGSATPYYFDYCVGSQEPVRAFGLSLKPMGWFNGLGLLANLLGILFSKPLATRFGKRNTFAMSIAVTALITAGFYTLSPDGFPTIVGAQVLLQLVYGVSIPLLWAMMADVADFTEWKTGRRATAMTFAATVFALKIGLSLGGAIAGWLLARAGYVANSVDQSPAAVEEIRRMMSVAPAAAFGLAAVAMAFYRIDRSDELRMGSDLAARRRQHDPEGVRHHD